MRYSRNKLRVSLTICAVALVAFGIAAWIALQIAAHIADQRTRTRLEESLDFQVKEMKDYIETTTTDLQIISEVGHVQSAIVEFSLSFRALGENPTTALQDLYIHSNPYGVGSRDSLLKADDQSAYSDLHADYHGWFKKIVSSRDLYDLFLINPNSDIVYTVYKEEDLGTNLRNGPFRDTRLAEVVEEALIAAPGAVVASDFEPYQPSAGIPAAFMAIPIYSDGEVAGALAVQLRIDPFVKIMSPKINLSDSTETYLVNSQEIMITDSRLVEDAGFRQTVSTTPVKQAIAGGSGTEIGENYQGDVVYSAYRPFHWQGGNWAVIAETGVGDIRRIIDPIRDRLILVGAIVVVCAFFLGWILAAKE